MIIDSGGDLLLHVNYYEDFSQEYRVSISALREHSAYFSALLDSTKFSEGIAVKSKLADLRKMHIQIKSTPATELPRISISDVGIGPRTADDTVEAAFRLFLRLLHSSSSGIAGGKAHIRLLFALVIRFADIFTCATRLSQNLQRLWENEYAHRLSLSYTKEGEEAKTRQMLYIALRLGVPNDIWKYSAALVVWGSQRWLDEDPDIGSTNSRSRYPWEYLPMGVEGELCAREFQVIAKNRKEELAGRRSYVLDTIASLQSSFLEQYSSRKPQCKLRYDSSVACDAFQLGEMVRFFKRKGTLDLRSTFAGSQEDLKPFEGNLAGLLRILKECPMYQIDTNHFHCGLRTRLIPRVNIMDPWNQVGLCLDCWQNERNNESWLGNPNKAWSYGSHLEDQRKKVASLCLAHRRAKRMYTASDRDWTGNVPV